MKKYMLPLISATFCCAAALATARTAVTADHSAGGTGNWWLTAENWNPAGVPGGSDDCLITKANNSATCRFGDSSTAASFTGNSLQIGEVGKAHIVFVDQTGTSTPLTFPGTGLIFGRASFRAWDNVPNAVINGNLTILSTSTYPSDFSAAKANTTYTLSGKLIGSTTSVLCLKEENGDAQLHFPLTFDASEFEGTLVYEPHTKPVESTFGSITFNGTISATNSEFKVPNGVSATVSRMAIQGTDVKLVAGVENAITGVKGSGLLSVEEIVLGEGAKLRYAQTTYPGTWKQGADGKTLWKFLTVPVESDLDLDRIVLDKRFSMTSGVFYPEFDMVVETNGTTKTFVSRRRAYVQVEVSAPTVYSNDEKFYYGTTLVDEADYFTKGSVARVHQTPQCERSTFAGKSFCLWMEGAQHGLQIRTHHCTIGDFRLQCGEPVEAAYVYNNADEANLYGGLLLFTNKSAIASAKARFIVGGFLKSLNIMSDISGSADAVMETSVEGDAASQPRTLTFGGDNTAWAGGMLVTNRTGVANRFIVTRGEALGGPLEAFRADALTLGANAIFAVTNDVAMSEPTRGMTVDGSAKVDVAADKILTYGAAVTFASGATLAKTGGGVLALGGKASVSGNAALDVQQGYVKPLETNSLDGVTLSFAAGAALLMEVPEAGADGVGRYGIVNPVLANGATLRVKVPFSSEPQTSGGKVSVPVCTVASGSADALKDRIVVEKPWENFVGKVGTQPNGDGTVTLLAEIMRSGMCVIFR